MNPAFVSFIRMLLLLGLAGAQKSQCCCGDVLLKESVMLDVTSSLAALCGKKNIQEGLEHCLPDSH